MNGILNLLKPPGMTSHDMVSQVRRITKIKKVGHTGTLDPNAAGVLPICIGQATKISQFLLDSKKKYRAELTLGIKTDTQDGYGKIMEEKEVNSTSNDIIDTVKSFIGEYHQIPPMYSAVRQQGKKLYELARAGIEVERKPRLVKIEDIDILHMDGKKLILDVICSKGTYIRTLCHDIGDALGCGGMMSFLLRTATGPFHLSSTISLEELADIDNINEVLFPVDFPLSNMPKVTIKDEMEKAALNGNKIDWHGISTTDNIIGKEMVRVYLKDSFIGLATVEETSDVKYIRFNRLFV
ncbi:tRNA pseudouridine(55) synthase TruB [Alkaliphilus peptidifermentans]|uniref:tRNA pseudouridine synthase B n=1 Tax=Alkaliphilus peptidifermentans DSM 18978 TaxID=1120976 RepID=A0A1G5DC58_9FIRM|nr:tRNA pseudouridine(55) synthase TruB [Alkaliphilus peptidifermentans]SCY12302.1 tRNA pseudouridine synthase B [Alkaliphilus peptidifermentans DSM 18978]